jgi:hypothetical protein
MKNCGNDMLRKISEMLVSESDSTGKEGFESIVDELPQMMQDSDGSMLDSLLDLQTRLSEASKEEPEESEETLTESDIEPLLDQLHNVDSRDRACCSIARMSWDSSHARRLASKGAIEALTALLEGLEVAETSPIAFHILRSLGNITFVVGNTSVISLPGMQRLLQLCW